MYSNDVSNEWLRLNQRIGKIIRSSSIFPLLFGIATGLSACGGGGGGNGVQPQSVTISILPSAPSVLLGNSTQFTATVSGSSNTNVSWSVNGIAGGNNTVGTISAAGLYTAPGDLPSSANVNVIATSQADSSKSASTTATIASDIAISIQETPANAVVVTSGSLQLNVTVQTAGKPDESVTWSVNGVQGGNSTVGTVIVTGTNTATYTAPSAAPFPAAIAIKAISVADTSKSASAIATVMVPLPSILVASGLSASGGIDTAEVYDVASRTWIATANSIPDPPPTNQSGLCYPNLAPLGTGKVLLAGGGCIDQRITTNAASLYNPITNQWAATNPMSFGRDQFGMVAESNGNAMAIAGCAGGCEGPNAQGQFFTTVSTSAEIYNAQSGTWSTVASLNAVHANFAVNNLLQGSLQFQDGRILACGGSDANTKSTATCEIFSPSSNTWTITGSLPQPCELESCPMVLLPNGNALIVNADGMTSAVFNPAQGTWQASGTLVSEQLGGTLTVLGNGKVLLTGGSSTTTTAAVNSAEIYDPTAGTWSLTTPMNTSRYRHVALLLSNGTVLAAGGEQSSTAILSSAEIYDPSSAAWTPTASMIQPRCSPGIAGLTIRVGTQ